MANEGIKSIENSSFYIPFIDWSKTDILNHGIKLCKKMGINWKKLYKLTLTSYTTGNDRLQYYKTGSAVERIEAFYNLHLEDPVTYCDKEGDIVSWDTCIGYMKEVLSKS